MTKEQTPSIRSFLGSIYRTIKFLALLFLFGFLTRYFIFQPYLVEGNSMTPNFLNKEYLLVDRISYRFRSPQRGEVIIFKPPNRNVSFIKRIIGLPGEKIVIKNNKVIIYNKEFPKGFRLKENYLENEITKGEVSQSISPDQYFVLGDNRGNSSDSRDWGTIPLENISGRAFLAVFPISKFGLIRRPSYEDLQSFFLKPFSLLHPQFAQIFDRN